MSRNIDILKLYVKKLFMFRENKKIYIVSNDPTFDPIETLTVLDRDNNSKIIKFAWFKPNENEMHKFMLQRIAWGIGCMHPHYINNDKLHIIIGSELFRLEKRIKDHHEIYKRIKKPIVYPEREMIEVMTITIDGYHKTENISETSINFSVKYTILQLQHLSSAETMENGMIYVGMREYFDYKYDCYDVTVRFLELMNKKRGEYREIQTTEDDSSDFGLFNNFDALYTLKPLPNLQTHFKKRLKKEIETLFKKLIMQWKEI